MHLTAVCNIHPRTLLPLINIQCAKDLLSEERKGGTEEEEGRKKKSTEDIISLLSTHILILFLEMVKSERAGPRALGVVCNSVFHGTPRIAPGKRENGNV